MESTARIDTNILPSFLGGGKGPMAQNFIQQTMRHPGTVTPQAQRAGKTVSHALAKTLKKLRKRKS